MNVFNDLTECMQCKAVYIEDCKHQDVGIGGKRELPDYCYREDLIKDEKKPHLNESNYIKKI